jgi:hypothetical protein
MEEPARMEEWRRVEGIVPIMYVGDGVFAVREIARR